MSSTDQGGGWGTEYDTPAEQPGMPSETSQVAPPESDAAPEGIEGQDDWTPPTREEWEAAQSQLSTLANVFTPQLESQLQAELSTVMTPQQTDQAAMLAAIQPKEFSLGADEITDILENGNGQALVAAFQRFADVQKHNNAIAMNQAVLNGISTALPVMNATGKFYERYPELLGIRDTVEQVMWGIRAQNPQANELQILRATEIKLKPVIEKAKAIMAGNPRGSARTNIAPGPVAGGQPTQPRGRGNVKPTRVPTAEERIEQLARWNAGQ